MKKLLMLSLISGISFAMQPIPVPGAQAELKKGEWKSVPHAKLEPASTAAPSNSTRDRLVKERDELEKKARFHRENPSKKGKFEIMRLEKRIALIDKELEGKK